MKRILTGVAAAALWASIALTAQAAPLFEPDLKWSTMETPHFRIYYTPEFEAKAKEVAAIAEDAHAKLVPYMQVEPKGLTEVIIADGYDELNSMAHASPHRAVWLWQTAPNPDEGMLIGRYDQWLRLLFVHEYTHILQFEHSPWLVNQVNTSLGGLLLSSFPQLPVEITLNLPDLLANAPSFFTEGLAVHTESLYTPGGRGKEGDFEMTRRMAILEGKEPAYDQIMGRFLLDWPMGGYEYTWGTSFVEYLTRKHGEDAPARILKTYSAVPWLGLGNAVHRTVGVPMNQMWLNMMEELRTRYTAERAEWLARQAQSPFSKPTDVTTSGRYHRHPLWDTDGSLLYAEALKNKGPRLYDDKRDGSDRTSVMGKSTRSAASLDPTGKLIYFENDTSDTIKQLNSYRDIFVFDREAKKATRLTHAARTFAPQVSPDGTRIVAMTSGKGQSGLAIFDNKGTQLKKWTYDNNAYQFGNPSWSPDGKRIAVAVWRAGTRDLWLVDPEKGTQRALWTDKDLDFYPTWSRDGRHLIFTSDRGNGVFNLFAYDLQSSELLQLTDVLGGVYDPAVSPDGKTIAFVNYTGRGYDVQTIPFDITKSKSLGTLSLAPAPVVEAPAVSLASFSVAQAVPKNVYTAPIEFKPPAPVTTRSLGGYNPLPTFTPSVWFPVLGEDEWGTNLSIYSFWQDVLRMHQATLIGGYGFYSQRLNYGFRYDNATGLPQWSVAVNEFPAPGRVPLATQPGAEQRWANLWQWNKSASLSFEYPGLRNPMFDPPPITGDNWTAGLRTELVEDYALVPDLTPEEAKVVPEASKRGAIDTHPPVPTAQDESMANSVFLQWQRAYQVKYPYDYGPMDGQITTLGAESGVQTASNPTEAAKQAFAPLPPGNQPFARLWADHRFYRALPWGEKHSLAVRSTAGLVYNRNGEFFYSLWRSPFGYQPLSTINRWDMTTATDYNNRYVMMRGYNFLLGNRTLTLGAEYRVPLAEVLRGWGELPVFLSRVYGVGFVDSGLFWGFDSSNLGALPVWDDFKLGTGAELRMQTTMFQAVPMDVRAGFARGLTTGGEWQFNWGLGTTF